VARISSDYFLRSLALIAEVQDGDMIKAIVFLAVVAANTGHLEQTGQGSRFAGVDSAPPDDVRRPVSALAISQALGMPFETTRRYINRLIADGVLARVKKGVIAPVAVVGCRRRRVRRPGAHGTPRPPATTVRPVNSGHRGGSRRNELPDAAAQNDPGGDPG